MKTKYLFVTGGVLSSLGKGLSAAAIGARHPLIAFNVNLATDQLDVARAIARAIRERDGGLPGIKALGLQLIGNFFEESRLLNAAHQFEKIFDFKGVPL